MDAFQLLPATGAAAGESTNWLGAAALWVLAGIAVAAAFGAVALWLLLARARRIEELAGRLDAVEDLRDQVRKLVSARDDLDLRRIEHVLVDLREGQKTVQDALLRTVESAARSQSWEGPQVQGLGERVVNRLHSLGYERVHLVDSPEEVEELGAGDGEIQVEANRQGVLHKGRVVVRAGRIFAADLKSVYTAFP